MKKRKILVTSALPYANGDIHIGHLVEYLQTDFWVRFQKLRGNHCVYICADDTHGTPIMLKAKERNISAEQLIAESKANHERDFSDFQIQFDNFGSTNSDKNKELCYSFYEAMKSNKQIVTKEIQQNYCETDKMFLPDRFVRGICPKCSADDQYGDSCDNCGASYSSTDLKDKRCSICNNAPVMKASEHLFFKLDQYKDFLKEWVPKHTQKEIANKLNEWLDGDLKEWNISRDEPYFGFEIPDMPRKYFYVWVDAPVGYIASTYEWAENSSNSSNNESAADYWQGDNCELYHFIGKDIVYFHTLFWPAMLKCANYKLPDKIFVHGFLKVNGEKMSKSKGTFIRAATYLEHLDAEYLRYYFASKLSSGIDDLDLNFTDFLGKVNSEFIGKITNLISRGAQMLTKKLAARTTLIDEAAKPILKIAVEKSETIAAHYENRDFNKAIVEIRDIADEANRYFDTVEPWNLIKTDEIKTAEVLTATVNLFRVIAIYLKPILPEYVAKVEELLGDEPYTWQSLHTTHENREIKLYQHLAKRIDQKDIDAMVEASMINN